MLDLFEKEQDQSSPSSMRRKIRAKIGQEAEVSWWALQTIKKPLDFTLNEMRWLWRDQKGKIA